MSSLLLKHLVCSVAGTTAMTAFSYLYSHERKGHFREPELLGQLLARGKGEQVNQKHMLTGFALHYLVGMGFSLGYEWLWKNGLFKPGLASGSILGALSGFLGQAVWKKTVRAHPDPPSIRYKEHYFQLIPAHVIFGAVTAKMADWWEE